MLIAGCTASFLTTFMSSSITVALPAISGRFSLSAIGISWVTASYLLAAVIFLLPVGRIADLTGNRKIFIWGIAAYTASSILCAVSVSGDMLIICRALQGAAAAMIFSTSMGLVVSTFEPHERGRVLGYTLAATYIGLSVGPFLGGILTHYAGWRSIFAANALIGGYILSFVARIPDQEHPRGGAERFDFTGALIYAAALGMLMGGLGNLSTPAGISLAGAGAVCLGLFSLYETRVPHPLIDVKLFLSNRVFVFSNLATLINYAATFAVSFLLSLYLQYIKGYSAAHTGLILIVQSVIQAAFSPAAGRLSDRIESRTVASCGMGLTGLSVFTLVFISAATPLWYIIVSLSLLGLGFALFSSPNANAVMSSVDKRQYGVASAVFSTMRMSGHMVSMASVMIIFSLHLGTSSITPALHGAFLSCMRTMFIVSCVFCTAGIFASLARGKTRP